VGLLTLTMSGNNHRFAMMRPDGLVCHLRCRAAPTR
jgi:hypothetical protein